MDNKTVKDILNNLKEMLSLYAEICDELLAELEIVKKENDILRNKEDSEKQKIEELSRENNRLYDQLATLKQIESGEKIDIVELNSIMSSVKKYLEDCVEKTPEEVVSDSPDSVNLNQDSDDDHLDLSNKNSQEDEN